MRQRRANAGSKIQELLDSQVVFEDDASGLFAEREDDEDFDLEAEEQRLQQERESRLESKRQTSEGAADSNGEDDDDDDDDESDAGGDDENFSDSSDDELEQDDEPADIGEKELVKEQRQANREQKVKERNKMFVIRQRPEAPAKPKKKRVFNSADILLEKSGRRSERKSAMRNKRFLIDQMREAEERRAQHVAPKKPRAPKLTQAQRLEEAQQTEMRNLASLNKFLELEEERKRQQRLAMLSRRPKLTQFVRYRSCQYEEKVQIVPLPTFVPYMPYNGQPPTTARPPSAAFPQLNAQYQPPQAGGVPGGPGGPGGPFASASPYGAPIAASDTSVAPNQQGQVSPAIAAPLTGHEVTTETGSGAGNTPESRGPSAPGPAASESTASTPGSSVTPNSWAPATPQPSAPATAPSASTPTTMPPTPPANPAAAHGPGNDGPAAGDGGAGSVSGQAGVDDATSLNSPHMPAETPKLEDNAEVKPEIKEEHEPPVVYGPPQLKNFEFLSLHEFPTLHHNKQAIKTIVMGPIASSTQHPPAKRLCPFSGKVARFRDPQTDIAYYDLATYKRIDTIRQNKLNWSKELGGVFTAGVRPANGVPPGFA